MAVMNGAKYQSLSNYLHLTYGYPTREVAFLFSLSNLCGLTFGLIMLSIPSVREKLSRLHVMVLLFQASAFALNYFYRDVYGAMILQRVLEGFVFAYIMNFYPVALTRFSRPEKAELVMCMWGLVYALGFAFSNGIAALNIPDAIAFNMPSLMLFACLLFVNKKIMLSVRINNAAAGSVGRPQMIILGKIGLVAVPFFLFTFVYNNFLFAYSLANPQSNPLYWMMLVNGAGILLSNALVSSGRLNATFYLALLIVVLWIQTQFSSTGSLPAAAGVILVLGLIEGVVFGFFIRHFASGDFDLVKAGYLVSGSLGATLGPLLPLHFGTKSLPVSALFLTAVICLLTLNESRKRSLRLSAGEEHV
ncbi:hypothetical protein SAMN06273570_5254 [Candidatus Pantoea floridensis]|uniref:Uncharacterized protein n=2 Tax=Candidatus Pantoea floridensis TaxID=1938870 RepID=A0A286DSN5_9GAMM|nr:hypothetical protein BX596_5249 [Enterobacteriaceae bacterium JKS000233]SOD61697.1 hypothetical protein SAMN06273570_5254 [Pantoea floridensis]